MQHTFKAGVFAIIFDNENRVLLCHRRDLNLWNMPGGAVEEGESPWDAVIRETKEEIGVDIETNHLLGVYFKQNQNEIGFAFIATITGGKITLTDEADDIQYFSVDNLPENLRPKQVERIRDAVVYRESEKALMKIQL